MKFKFKNGLIHVTYKSQEELAKTFVRIQEHYENPYYRGKVFTLGQLREWYSEFHGGWTYFADWNGFNVPAQAMIPFVAGEFDPLSKEEQGLIDALRYQPNDYYLIGTHEGDEPETLLHEKLHAIYYLRPAYKLQVDEYLATVFNTGPVMRHLRDKGYHEQVIQDELQAYMGGSKEYLREEGFFKDNHLEAACDEVLNMAQPYLKELET
jgi:hypothetical protein